MRGKSPICRTHNASPAISSTDQIILFCFLDMTYSFSLWLMIVRLLRRLAECCADLINASDSAIGDSSAPVSRPCLFQAAQALCQSTFSDGESGRRRD